MNVLEVFTGNPLNTPVGQRIDKATDGSLDVEDWALNMEICDIINETDDGPKEAIRAIRKKISNGVGKDWRSISYCLVVMETCVKNCGKRFHIQIANKDFLNDLVKIISPKNEPTVGVQEKILSLIQSWADAFRGAPELKAVDGIYQELRSKGIEFPATDMDQMAPIHTPKGHAVESPVRHTPTQPIQPPPRATMPAALGQPVVPPVAAPAAAPQRPTAEQMSKLRADIDLVQGNCRVFNEMLNAVTHNPTELTPDTTELMRELNRTCRQMQQRVVLLIEQLADEQVTEVLLRVNDDLNNAFLRYDRLERSFSTSAAPQPTSQSAAAPPPTYPSVTAQPAATVTTNQTAEQSLIDFGSSEPNSSPAPASASALAAHMDSMNLQPASNIAGLSDISTQQSSKPGSDEFDVFAQSRQYDATQHNPAASYSFQSEAGGQSAASMGAAASGNYATQQPSATSSEFDQFLSERISAGERLPSVKATGEEGQQTVAAPGTPQRGANAARQMHKDDSENALFAL